MRVLLADDHAIHQQLVGEILREAGVQVHIVEDGEAAVRKVDAARYDAVLMDIQMPALDGYAATACIRRNPRHRRLPIIAMTAHAALGFREQCLVAGMDDYITKPIEPDKLFATLARWTGFVPPRPAKSAHADLDLPAELPGIDIGSLLVRVNGNRGLIRRLLTTFATHYERTAQDLAAALAQADWKIAAQLTHTMTGSAGNLSATRLAQAAAELERAIRRRDCKHATARFAEFAIAFDELLATARGIARAHASGPSSPLDETALMQQLAEQLADGYADAVASFDALCERLGERACDPAVVAVRRCMARYDFDGALAALERWKGKPPVGTASSD
ncbi:MAG TPA: response regulator, partial [Rudaea sp.]